MLQKWPLPISHSSALLGIALDSTICGVIISDPRVVDNPIIYANKGFLELTGYLAEDILGRNCRFLQGNDHNQPGIDTIREALALRQGCKVSLRNYRKDGSLFWNELIISPVFEPDGELTHFIGVQNDVTEIVELKQLRDDYVATLVHDLKNPLIGANRIFEFIARGSMKQDDQLMILRKVQESNHSMLRMVGNALDYYRSESGPLAPDYKQFDLSALCRRMVEDFRFEANEKSIKLCEKFPPVLTALGDESLIRRVLMNLLDNAIKFTPSNGTISVAIEQSDCTNILVTNSGVGMTPEEVAGLFERFHQTTKGKSYTAGTGLGLFLCRQIMEAHKGTISCHSEPGGDTEFKLAMPSFVG